MSFYISDQQAPSNSYQHIASKVWGHMIFSRGGGGVEPIGVWEGGDKYNLNNPKHNFTILSKVEGLTPNNLDSSA